MKKRLWISVLLVVMLSVLAVFAMVGCGNGNGNGYDNGYGNGNGYDNGYDNGNGVNSPAIATTPPTTPEEAEEILEDDGWQVFVGDWNDGTEVFAMRTSVDFETFDFEANPDKILVFEILVLFFAPDADTAQMVYEEFREEFVEATEENDEVFTLYYSVARHEGNIVTAWSWLSAPASVWHGEF